MGLLLLEAVQQRDYRIITGVFLAVGVAVMFINLVVAMPVCHEADPPVRELGQSRSIACHLHAAATATA